MTEKVKSKNIKMTNKIVLESGIEIDLKVINLDLRCSINDKLLEVQDKPNFSTWVWLLREVTKLSDDDINDLSTEQIVETSTKVVEFVNKKK